LKSSNITQKEITPPKSLWDKYGAIIPAAVTLLCLGPFVDKAFHIDDPLFIWTAKHILKHPADFYNFPVNWYECTMPMFGVTQNPPLACYYLALVGGLIGWGERVLHIAFLLPAAAAATGTYYLARRLCRYPVTAALATVLTPVFLVSSSNVMCDTMMVAFWIWAIVLWLKGIKENKALFLTLSAFLMGICALTKYFGMSLIGLLLIYTLIEKRGLSLWMLLFLIPGAMLAGYQWYTHKLYMMGLLFQAAAYANYHRWKELSDLLPNGLIGLAFSGGCAITVLFYSPWLWSKRMLIGGGLLTVLLVFTLPYTITNLKHFSFIDDDKNIKWLLSGQMALFTTSGVGIMLLAVRDFWKSRGADSLMLMLWVLGTFVFAGFINWTVNARSVYPMIPAVGILIMRQWERREKEGAKPGGLLRRWLPLTGAAIVTLAVCYADYVWANTARQAANAIDKEYKDYVHNVFFQGHWGFQYYMEGKGYLALEKNDKRARKNDILIVPTNTSRQFAGEINLDCFDFLKITPFPYAATMSSNLGAGFYAIIWGPLPYAFGTVDPEYYYFFKMK